MSAAKHTPGPWRHGVLSAMTNPPKPVGIDVVSASGGYVCSLVLGNDADARLIAAAPELLEALRIFIGAAFPVAKEINERGHNWSEAYLDQALTNARAAIAKATGGSGDGYGDGYGS